MNFDPLQQQKTKLVDRVEQKVTTNPKLGQNRKRRSVEEKQTYNFHTESLPVL